MATYTQQDIAFLKKLKEQGVSQQEAFRRLDMVKQKISASSKSSLPSSLKDPEAQKIGETAGAALDYVPGAKPLIRAGLEAAHNISSGVGQIGEGVNKINEAVSPRQEYVTRTKRAITMQDGVKSYVPALDEQYTAVAPGGGPGFAERLTKATGGAFDVLQGGMNTAFAAPSAAINQVPIARDVVGFGMEKLEEGSKFASDRFKEFMQIDPNSEEAKVIDKGFSLLGQLLPLKAGETMGKLQGSTEAAKLGAEAPKMSLMDKAITPVVKPLMKVGEIIPAAQKALENRKIKRAYNAVSKATDVYRQAIKTTPKTQQYLDKRGIDVAKTLAEERIPIETQKINNKVKYDTLEQAEVLRDRAMSTNEALKKALSNLPAKDWSLTRLYDRVRESILKDESIFEKNKTTLTNNLKDLIDMEIARYGDTVDNITYQNIKTKAWNESFSKNGTITNEIANDLGHIIKSDLESAYKGNLDIKKLNKYQGDLIESAKTLEKMHGQVVSNGALGKMLGGVKGLIVGASIPGISPITALIGKYIGENLTEYMANPERKTIKAADKLKKSGYISPNQKLASKAANIPKTPIMNSSAKPLGGGTIPNPLDPLLDKVPGAEKFKQFLPIENKELRPRTSEKKITSQEPNLKVPRQTNGEFTIESTKNIYGNISGGKIHLLDGELKFSIEDGVMTIDDIEVKVQKKGTGTKLMKKAEELAKKEGIETIELGAFPQNASISSQDLVKFYEKLGYEVISSYPFDGKTYTEMKKSI